MKNLKEFILESILGEDENLVKDFLKKNYDIKGSYTIKDDVVDVKGNITVKNKGIITLNNGLFKFGKVTDGSFNCEKCPKLISLEGGPKEVEGYFDCTGCSKLKTLDGAPKKVGGDFYCYGCESLISLEGSPKEIGGEFNCEDCPKLKSLKGAPQNVRISSDIE